MRELQAKQRRKYLIYSYPSLAILLIITLLIIKGTVSIALKERSSAAKLKNLEQESVELRAEKAQLEDKVALIQTDEGIKEEIKKKFSVTEEGEQVAIIVSPRTSSSSSEEAKTWPKKWWQRLKSLWP